MTDRVTLAAGSTTLFDADGSAFIIHANPDDQVTDVGNGGSGARIACAVVVPE
jgi:Cu-Zn family superoxide dismutase